MTFRDVDESHSTRVGASVSKRLIDIVVGTVLGLLAIPAILAIAVSVCLSFHTWRPFFLQKRIGRHGRLFTLPKLRTLPLNAPPTADKYAISGVETTRLGRFLRHTHLDELPQLLLVPTGRMSLVGPRPEMPWLSAVFDPGFVRTRTVARPGCTGLWQVSADADRLIGEVPEYDIYYLRHMSVRLDLWVVWQSMLVLVGGRRVSCTDVPRWARRVGRVPDADPALEDAASPVTRAVL